jgi:hypothetical protein
MKLHLLEPSKNSPDINRILVNVCIFLVIIFSLSLYLMIMLINKFHNNSVITAIDVPSKIAKTDAHAEVVAPTDNVANKILFKIPTAKSTFLSDKKERAPVSDLIFSDHLGQGWNNDSWGITYLKQLQNDLASNSVSVFYEKPWSGLSYYSDGFITTGYAGLFFEVNFQNAQTKDLYVSLYDPNGKIKTVPLVNYIDTEKSPLHSWYKIFIPLSDFAPQTKVISHLTIESSASENISFREIKFVRESIPVVHTVTPLVDTQGIVASMEINKDTNTETANMSQEDGDYQVPLLTGWSFYTNEADVTSASNPPGVLRVVFHKPWSSLGFRNPKGFDISGADTIALSVADDEYSNARLYVVAYDMRGKKLGSVFLNDYIFNKKITVHAYTKVLIPLKKLGATGDTIGGISIESEESTGVVSINSISFMGLVEKSTGVVSLSQIYKKGFRNDWAFDTTSIIANPASAARSGVIGNLEIESSNVTESIWLDDIRFIEAG